MLSFKLTLLKYQREMVSTSLDTWIQLTLRFFKRISQKNLRVFNTTWANVTQRSYENKQAKVFCDEGPFNEEALCITSHDPDSE